MIAWSTNILRFRQAARLNGSHVGSKINYVEILNECRSFFSIQRPEDEKKIKIINIGYHPKGPKEEKSGDDGKKER